MADVRDGTDHGAPQGTGLSRERLDVLAEHFDITDAADFSWEEATDVEIRRPELEQVSLRLPKEDLAQLKAQAARASIGYTTLIRMVLHRHLRASAPTSRRAQSAPLEPRR